MFRFSVCLLVASCLPAAFNQLISFKDGKIGVNFGGYHAEAGLGGLLTGDAAHGGLSASAGTPFGQRAGAGLGGTVDGGQTRGGLYAGASGGYGTGASAALGGRTDEYGASGGSGAEAHAAGHSTKTVKLSQTPQQPQYPQQETYVQRKEVASIDQRSSFANDAPEQPSIVQQTPIVQQQPPIVYQQPPIVQQQPPIVQQQPQVPDGRRYYKRKEIRRLNKQKNKEVLIERRFDAPPQNYANNYQAQAPPQNFDYTKFFDFGFFSNAAAGYSGAPHPATQGGQVYSYQKQISPNTVVLHKTVIPSHSAYAAEAQVDERIGEDGGSSDESYEVDTKTKTKTRLRSDYGGPSGATTYTATKQFQPNPNFFADIFNIPISTLGAVSQFLSNGAAAGGGYAVTKTKTYEHS